MLRASATVKLATAPDEVWETLKSFANLEQWHPEVTSCVLEGEGVGGFRVLQLDGGETARDLLESFGDGSYSYVAVETTLPVTNWRSTLNLYLTRPSDDEAVRSCVVQWSGSFESAGIPPGDAILRVLAFYQSGLNYLEHIFGAAP